MDPISVVTAMAPSLPWFELVLMLLLLPVSQLLLPLLLLGFLVRLLTEPLMFLLRARQQGVLQRLEPCPLGHLMQLCWCCRTISTTLPRGVGGCRPPHALLLVRQTWSILNTVDWPVLL